MGRGGEGEKSSEKTRDGILGVVESVTLRAERKWLCGRTRRKGRVVAVSDDCQATWGDFSASELCELLPQHAK